MSSTTITRCDMCSRTIANCSADTNKKQGKAEIDPDCFNKGGPHTRFTYDLCSECVSILQKYIELDPRRLR